MVFVCVSMYTSHRRSRALLERPGGGFVDGRIRPALAATVSAIEVPVFVGHTLPGGFVSFPAINRL